jgi:hypothetical protein
VHRYTVDWTPGVILAIFAQVWAGNRSVNRVIVHRYRVILVIIHRLYTVQDIGCMVHKYELDGNQSRNWVSRTLIG